MLAAFTAVAVVMTFLGGLLPSAQALLSREGLSRLFSARAGILLAVAFTEILPEAWRQNHALAGWAALSAFVLLFVMSNVAMIDSCPEYLAECHVHRLGLTALFALTAHSFIDGLNLGVSFAAGARAGAAVGLALALHKIADGFTLTSLFAQSGYGRRKSLWALCGVASATPLASWLSSRGFGGFSPSASAALLGFAAGCFIYIAAADILPRLHRERDRAGLAYFGLGMLGMGALKIL